MERHAPGSYNERYLVAGAAQRYESALDDDFRLEREERAHEQQEQARRRQREEQERRETYERRVRMRAQEEAQALLRPLQGVELERAQWEVRDRIGFVANYLHTGRVSDAKALLKQLLTDYPTAPPDPLAFTMDLANARDEAGGIFARLKHAARGYMENNLYPPELTQAESLGVGISRHNPGNREAAEFFVPANVATEQRIGAPVAEILNFESLLEEGPYTNQTERVVRDMQRKEAMLARKTKLGY